MKTKNWTLPTCDSFPLIVSHIYFLISHCYVSFHLNKFDQRKPPQCISHIIPGQNSWHVLMEIAAMHIYFRISNDYVSLRLDKFDNRKPPHCQLTIILSMCSRCFDWNWEVAALCVFKFLHNQILTHVDFWISLAIS